MRGISGSPEGYWVKIENRQKVTNISKILNSKEEALKRAEQLLDSSDSRVVVGIFGKPGVGKSTLTEFLAKRLPRDLVEVVSMDGFHLSNKVLNSLGLSTKKGAPETFDVSGFDNLLARIRATPDQAIYYPIFDREIEESIAAQGCVSPAAKLILVEGNYLLHDRAGWESISTHFDEGWYLSLSDDIRVERLIQRHIKFGKSPEFARDWSLGTDEQNAILIEQSAHLADFVVILD